MIRDATESDIPALVELGRQMATESPRFSRLTYAPDKLAALFRALIASVDGYLVVDDRDEQLVGVMAAMVSDHWMALERTASDFGVFVLPEHRGDGSAKKMIDRYRDWARARGAVEIGLGISTGVHVEATACFYQSIGLQQCGLLFEVPHV